MKRRWLILALAAGALPAATWAAAGGRAALAAFVKSAASASGRFTQTLFDKTGRPADAPSAGVFAFERPGRFAWRTETPYVQEIVADKTAVKLWDRDLNQVTVRSVAGAVTAAPAALLFGDEKALEAFVLTESADRMGGAVSAVKAVPKTEDASFAEATVGFDAAGVPVFMRLTDHFGLVTELVFSDVKKNPRLAAEDFALHAPADADILEDRTNVF